MEDRVGGLEKIYGAGCEQRTTSFPPIVMASSSGIGGSSGTGSAYANTTSVVEQNSVDINQAYVFSSTEFTTTAPQRQKMY